MSVPLFASKFDLSTQEGRREMLLWLAEADDEVAVFIRDTAERERRARQGIKDGTSPCAHISV